MMPVPGSAAADRFHLRFSTATGAARGGKSVPPGRPVRRRPRLDARFPRPFAATLAGAGILLALVLVFPITAVASAPVPAPAVPRADDGAPPPEASPPAEASPTIIVLAGRVLSDPSGDPVAGARVWRTDRPEAAVFTGADGLFLLPLPPSTGSDRQPGVAGPVDGALHLHATAAGHGPATARIPAHAIAALVSYPRESLRGAQILQEPTSAEGRPQAGVSKCGVVRGWPARTVQTPFGCELKSALRSGGDEGSEGEADNGDDGGSAPTDPTSPAGPASPEAVPPVPAVTLVLLRQAAITGRVVGPGDEPLPGAVLRYRRVPPPGAAGTVERQTARPWQEAEAGQGGFFRLEDLAAGRTYQIQGFADGAAPAEWVATAGEEGVLLRLAPGAGVEGRVVDATGAPAAGAEVTLYLEVEDRQLRGPGAEAATTTADAEGLFRLDGLSADRYALGVDAPRSAPFRLHGLELPEGRLHDLGRLVLKPEVVLEGRVVDADGAAVPGAHVVLLRGGDSPWPDRRTVTGDGGRFRLDALPSGEVVDVQVDPPPPASGLVLSNLPLPTDGPLELIVRRGASVVGRVLDREGRALAGVPVELRGRVQSGLSTSAPILRRGMSGADGEYRLDGLPAGTVVLRADPPPALHRHRPTVIDSMRLIAGEVHGPVDLVLEPEAPVEGTVRHRDGTPASRVRVVARPVGLDGSTLPRTAVISTLTDAAGAFRLDGLAPGGLQLDVVTYRGRARWRGTVGEDGTAVDLVVEPRRHVSGQVLSPEGRPVARARVQLGTPGGGVGRRVYASEVTGVDGRFLLLDVAPGRYRVEASADGYATASQSDEAPWVELGEEPTGVEGVVVVLDRGASVVGHVDGVEAAELGAVQVLAHRTLEGGRTETRNGRLSADGSYRIAGLAPGHWRVWARLPATGRTDSAALEVRSGDREIPLDLHLAGGLIVTGEVRVNGALLTGGHVGLFPRERGEGVNVPLRHDGTFRAEGVTPGAVRVRVMGLAHDDGPEDAMHLVRELDLSADRHLLLDFPVGAVRCRLVDSLGQPIHGTGVSLQPVQSSSPAGPTVLYARTDRTGTATFPRVQEGRWLLQVHGGPDHGSLTSTEVAVSAMGEVVVELALSAP